MALSWDYEVASTRENTRRGSGGGAGSLKYNLVISRAGRPCVDLCNKSSAAAPRSRHFERLKIRPRWSGLVNLE